MTALPAIPTFSLGNVPTTSLNRLSAVLAFLMEPPIAELRQIVAQSLTNGAFTTITFTAEDIDNPDGHNNAVDNSRYYATYPGWYEISGAVGFAASAAGNRGVQIAINGVGPNGAQALTATATAANAPAIVARTKHFYLDVGDYVELQAFQNSGGAINSSATAGEQSGLSIRWVHA